MLRASHEAALKLEMESHDRLLNLQREEYQRKLNVEYDRALRLCRGQLHRWAADGFYELFQAGQLSGPRMRAMFGEAERMLSPERLLLAEIPKED
jgi:hypothetical protein